MGEMCDGDGEVEIEKESSFEEKKSNLENEGNFGGPVFNPPLYRQRYSTVLSVLRQHGVTKVSNVDSTCVLQKNVGPTGRQTI